MSLRPKNEISRIRRHISSLKKAPWLGQTRSWWPNCLFHCTDIQNAISILKTGELLSREQVKKAEQLQVDIASRRVIANTSMDRQDYARLYFRPKTPTQFLNEGFRPIGHRPLDAHCPVPVYFLFDAISVLSRSDSFFTHGNLASVSVSEPSNSVDELKQIPFELVYHVGPFGPAERDTIIFHRNAEVLVPERLGLAGVRRVFCRSQAEYETFLHLLPPGTLSKWVNKIGVRPDLGLFHNRWTFVNEVDMSTDSVVFKFNKATEAPGPFNARVQITESATGLRYSCDREAYYANDNLSLKLHTVKNPEDYLIRLTLDEHLAFAGRYQEEDLPF